VQNLSVLCGKTKKYGKFITKSARHPVLNTASGFYRQAEGRNARRPVHHIAVPEGHAQNASLLAPLKNQ